MVVARLSKEKRIPSSGAVQKNVAFRKICTRVLYVTGVDVQVVFRVIKMNRYPQA